MCGNGQKMIGTPPTKHWSCSQFDFTSGPGRACMRSPSRETEDAERGNDSDCEHERSPGLLRRAIDAAIERWMDRRIDAAIESELGIPQVAALPDRLRVHARGVARRSRLKRAPIPSIRDELGSRF